MNSVLSKKATTEWEALSRQKSISISSNAQKENNDFDAFMELVG